MITIDEYDRVQTLLGRDGRPRPQSHHEFAFTGLIRCGDCKRMVTAEEKHQLICDVCKCKFAYRTRTACPRCETLIEKMKEPKFLHYTYYHCSKSQRPTCRQKSINGEELEKQICAKLERISISEKFKEWAIKYLREMHEYESADRNAIIQAQQKAYQECLAQIDGLVSLHTSPANRDGSLLSHAEYAERRGRLLKEKAALEELLNDTGHRVEQQLKLSEHVFEFACQVRERFEKGSIEDRKTILDTIGSNLVLKDKKLIIEATKPFFILENELWPGVPEKQSIEPKKTQTLQGWNHPIIFARPCWLGDVDDDRTLRHTFANSVKSIYRFFRSVCESPTFKLSDWWNLYHWDKSNDWKN